MKYSVMLLAMAAISFTSCEDGDGVAESTDSTSTSTEVTNDRPTAEVVYYDLRSGNAVTRDEASGRYIDESGTQVDFYVDPQAHDTFYNATGQNVNNSLIHEGDNWRVDDSRMQLAERENVKVKTEDGKMKVEDNKVKVKNDDVKMKTVDRDEDGSSKTKIKER